MFLRDIQAKSGMVGNYGRIVSARGGPPGGGRTAEAVISWGTGRGLHGQIRRGGVRVQSCTPSRGGWSRPVPTRGCGRRKVGVGLATRVGAGGPLQAGGRRSGTAARGGVRPGDRVLCPLLPWVCRDTARVRASARGGGRFGPPIHPSGRQRGSASVGGVGPNEQGGGSWRGHPEGQVGGGRAHGRASQGEGERGGGPAFPVQSGLPPNPGDHGRCRLSWRGRGDSAHSFPGWSDSRQ